VTAIASNAWKARPRQAFWFVVCLAVALAAMRAMGMLGPASLRALLPLGFVLMGVAPWVLLTQHGRRQIGLCRSSTMRIYAIAVVSGASAAITCGVLGFALFGTGADNWFISIADYYRRSAETTGLSLFQLHLIFTLPALLFSPLGEEIFFRGILQRALEDRFSARAATTVECAAFGLVHVLHHGVVATAAGIVLLPRSAVIWASLMFAAAWLFAWLRKRSGSLYPAMAAHASFNVAMNAYIFSVLWQRL
jgi:membrane protease YdiL (CAAX protease family)